jgi:hypothetical protein
MADVAILVPIPLPMPLAPDPPSHEWQHHFHLALAQCNADDEGWVALHELGGKLKAAQVKLPSGKLSELARKANGVECQGSQTAIRVRRTNQGPPHQKAPQEALPFVVSEAPGFLVDDEIPF